MKDIDLKALLMCFAVSVTVNCSESTEPVNSQPLPEQVRNQKDQAAPNYAVGQVPKGMTVQEKKARFRALVAPAINKVYKDLDRQFVEVSALIKNGSGRDKVEALKIKYKATSDEELLMALKPHPQSIAFAQAAMESGWGTSRFFREANNIFGVWSFNKDEPRMAASIKRGGKTIWVKKYPSLEASIRDNYLVLARGSAFKRFRKSRMKSNDPYQLVKLLDRYSERGASYGKELTSMIKFNKFYLYDE